MNIGSIGLWTGSRQWPADPVAIHTIAAEVEGLGFGALWLGTADGSLALAEEILRATTTLVVGTSIVNIWQFDAPSVAVSHLRVVGQFPDRFMLGLGVGHAPLDRAYVKPLHQLGLYLDDLDSAPHAVARNERMVAALGPRALDIAAERSAGTNPYLVTPEYTSQARARLGAGPLMVTEQKALFGTDPVRTRAVARRTLDYYLQLPNYLNNFRRFGLGDDDFGDGGSDRLVDALVAWGSVAAVRARLLAHLDAGADHVAVHALTAEPAAGEPVGPPLTEWRRLAEVLELRRPVTSTSE